MVEKGKRGGGIEKNDDPKTIIPMFFPLFLSWRHMRKRKGKEKWEWEWAIVGPKHFCT